MFKVGLTGGVASGKTSVSDLFSQYGITIVDADKIAKEIVAPDQPCLQKVIKQFGQQYFLADGQLDRAKLKQLIFSNLTAKTQLEQILHPKIREQLILQSNVSSSAYTILSIPLLIEANMQSLIDRILVIDISEQLQLQRLCDRDNIGISQAQQIIASQLPTHQQLKFADDVINNDGDNITLIEKVDFLHAYYLKLAKSLP